MTEPQMLPDNSPKFAPALLRNEEGWIILPRDSENRKNSFFPSEVMSHPAKMNMYMQEAIIDYVAKPGEILLDPFGGTGTLMIAALKGMMVILLELEDGYHKLEQEAKHNLELESPGSGSLVSLIQGDNRFLLPIPCHHIITSPPYAGAMDIRKVRTKREDAPDDWLVQMDKQMLEYSKSPRNISKLNTFLYNQAMERIYKLCYESILPGGTLTINIKDRIEGGKRVYLSKWIVKVCIKMGFKQRDWFKWKVPGSGFTNIARSQGRLVVDDEDVIIFIKE